MTKSQFKSLVAALVTAFGVLDAHKEVLAAVLPPKWADVLRIVLIVGGVLAMLFNQSLSTAHVSVPVEEAKALGLVSEQTGEGK